MKEILKLLKIKAFTKQKLMKNNDLNHNNQIKNNTLH